MFLTQNHKIARLFFMYLSNSAKLKLTKRLKSMYLVLESFTKLIYLQVYIKNFFPRKGRMVIYATELQDRVY